MTRLNRDAISAIVILLVGSVFVWATFRIPDMNYESLGSEVWPQFILVLLFLLTSAFLFKSLKQGPDEVVEGGGIIGWAQRYRNALWCYGLFFLFLFTLDYLGLLIGGVLFVFATLTALGDHSLRNHVTHAIIAVVSITFMWSIFTFGLKVILPQGEVFSAW